MSCVCTWQLVSQPHSIFDGQDTTGAAAVAAGVEARLQSKLRMKAVLAPVPDATRVGPCQRLIRRYLQCTCSAQTARSLEKSKGARRSLAAGLAHRSTRHLVSLS